MQRQRGVHDCLAGQGVIGMNQPPNMPQPAPMKIGMHHFAKMFTKVSTPVVLTLGPGFIRVAAADRLAFEGPAGAVSAKLNKVIGHLTVETPNDKFLLAAVGAAGSPAFHPGQEQEIVAAQQLAAQDPQTSQIRLSQTLWIGKPGHVDGSYSGGFKSMREGEAIKQNQIGRIVYEAMGLSGVSIK